MRNRISIALAAAFTLALAVNSASANKLSYSSQAFRIVWASLTFSESLGGVVITCPVTLEGSFHSRTLSKVIDSLVGYITKATTNSPACSEGHATILSESLPWHVTWRGFSGALPTINRVRHNLLGAAFQIEPGLGVVCLARTSETDPAAGEASRELREGAIISLTPDSSIAIPVTGTNCPRAGKFSGTGEVFVQGSSRERIRLTLI